MFPFGVITGLVIGGATGITVGLLTDKRSKIRKNAKRAMRTMNEFVDQMQAYPDIQTIYFITDSEKSFRDMSNQFANTTTYQLYRDYLDNFRINIGR